VCVSPQTKVRETVKRLAAVKTSIDTSAPASLALLDNLKGGYRKKQDMVMREHAYRLAHMHRRIQDYYNEAPERAAQTLVKTDYPGIHPSTQVTHGVCVCVMFDATARPCLYMCRKGFSS
jgi:hypothetical protein